MFYLFTKFKLMDSNLDDYYEQLWEQFTLPNTIYENITQCVYDYYFNETPFNEKYLYIIVKHSSHLKCKVEEISKEYINDEKENYSSIFEFVDVYNVLHDRIEELYDLLLIDMDTILCYLNRIYFKEKTDFIKENVTELVARDDIHYLKSFMLIIERHQDINKLFVTTYLEYHLNHSQETYPGNLPKVLQHLHHIDYYHLDRQALPMECATYYHIHLYKVPNHYRHLFH